jgi:thiol-disulfide isomerase/thioredoxin
LLEVGENAPEISQSDVFGDNFSLSALQGKVVLLNFMGTWCASCIWEMGDLIELHNLYANEDVVFLSIAIEGNGTVNDVIDFKSKYCADWTFILDEDDIFSSFEVELLPTTFVVDRFGVIAYSRVGLLDSNQLSNVLDEFRKV